MTDGAWTVYWAYGMTESYAVAPGGSPRDSHDLLILTVNPETHENGFDEKTAKKCAEALSKWWAGE